MGIEWNVFCNFSAFQPTKMLQLLDQDGELYLKQHYIPPVQANTLHQELLDSLAWQEETIRIYGKSMLSPRRVCWYGDSNAVYTYSGIRHIPKPWPESLLALRNKLQQFTGKSLNAVLGNHYRDGNDSVDWHADKEKELGSTPFLASLSFGDSRVFKIRHNKSKETVSVELNNGSLLLMGGELQRHWRHCVPKTKQHKNSRINLSFRYIYQTND